VRSLPEQIADLVRGRIMSGQLRPGDQVVESRLAKQLGVGQNAVREALQDLEFQGFVVKFPHRGTFVTKLSREDLDQIYRIRAELESLAVEWARKHNRPDARDLERLEAILEESEKGADAGDFYTFARADTEFHRCLWELSGNTYLRKALEVVAVPLLSYVLIESQEHTTLNLKRLVRQHRDWLSVIASSSAEEAAEYTRKSIQSFWEQIVEVIGDRPSQNA
jgi:DNA-binding GntR family transcriptional regulator